jgi:uncharacterized protein (UPF0305 family)
MFLTEQTEFNVLPLKEKVKFLEEKTNLFVDRFSDINEYKVLKENEEIKEDIADILEVQLENNLDIINDCKEENGLLENVKDNLFYLSSYLESHSKFLDEKDNNKLGELIEETSSKLNDINDENEGFEELTERYEELKLVINR